MLLKNWVGGVEPLAAKKRAGGVLGEVAKRYCRYVDAITEKITENADVVKLYWFYKNSPENVTKELVLRSMAEVCPEPDSLIPPMPKSHGIPCALKHSSYPLREFLQRDDRVRPRECFWPH